MESCSSISSSQLSVSLSLTMVFLVLPPLLSRATATHHRFAQPPPPPMCLGFSLLDQVTGFIPIEDPRYFLKMVLKLESVARRWVGESCE